MKTPLLKTIGLFAVALMLGAGTSGPAAADGTIEAGKDYELIDPPQPTADPTKVEVMEFFWYGCPHCYHFEPDLNAWLKKKPANVDFIRQPAIFNERWGAHAKAFFTAELLGVLDKVHKDFYDAIQNQKRSLESEEDLAAFFKEHGVTDEAFRNAYKSFAVDAKMRQAEAMGPRYGITGTPALVINGKYRTSGSLARSFTHMLEVTDELIRKETAALPKAEPAESKPQKPAKGQKKSR